MRRSARRMMTMRLLYAEVFMFFIGRRNYCEADPVWFAVWFGHAQTNSVSTLAPR